MAEEYMDDEYNEDGYVVKERRRWPFLLLGFFIGFITLPAILAIVIVSFINRPMGKTVNTVDRFTKAGLYETLFGNDDDYGILDERYSGMKLKDAISDISNIAGKGDQLTFADLNSISPQIEKTVDKLIETAKDKNIFLEKEAWMSTPLSELSTVLTDEVKEIELGMVLLATSPEMFEDENSGDILKNFFFGKEYVNYIETNGTIDMLPITYGFNPSNNTFVCVDETVFVLDGVTWKSEDGDCIRPTNDNKFELYNAEGQLVYELRSDDTRAAANYVAYAENEEGEFVPVKQSSLALGAFMGDNNDPISVIGKLDLGVLLGVNDEVNAKNEENKMIVAIAYGTYGTDYTFNNGKVVPLNGKKFTTLNDLMDEPDDILNNVQLGSLLGIHTREEAEDEDNAMLVALAYGTYGIDFEYDTDGTIIPKNGKEFTSLGELLNNPNETLRDIQIGPLLGITTKADVEANDSLLVSLSYGVYGEDFTYDEHGKITQIPGGKAFTTVEQLMDSKQSEEILKSVPLSSVFNVDIFDEKSDPLTLSLVYGTKGKHYTIEEKGGKKYIDWKINPETNEPYKERTFGDLRNGDMSDIINDIRLCDILPTEDDNGLISTLANKKDANGNPWTVAHLTDANIKKLTLGEVMAVDNTSHPLLIYMQNQTIEGLNNDYIDGISVKDALGIEETDDPILGSIMDLKLGDLKDSNKLKEKINGLHVSDLIEGADANFYLKHVKDSTIEDLPNKISNITIMALFEESIEKDPAGNPKKTWWYLLTYNPDDPTSYPYTAAKDYKVTDMDKLIENMHNNIEHATLNQMHDDGLIPHLGEQPDGTTTLDQELLPPKLAIYENAIRDVLGLEDGQPTPATIGDLTVLQASDYLGYLLSVVLQS